jgi:hypothetical protein
MRAEMAPLHHTTQSRVDRLGRPVDFAKIRRLGSRHAYGPSTCAADDATKARRQWRTEVASSRPGSSVERQSVAAGSSK